MALNKKHYKVGMLVFVKDSFITKIHKLELKKPYAIQAIRDYGNNSSEFLIKIEGMTFDPEYFSPPFGNADIGKLLYEK